MEWNTELKLEETKYFLDRMRETKTNPKACYFNYNAYLSAWHSTLETLLNDAAVYYGIRNYYWQKHNEIPKWLKTKEEKYLYAATKLRNARAIEFFGWIASKLPEKRQIGLSKERNESVHEGKKIDIDLKPIEITLPNGHFSLRGFVEYHKFEKEIAPYVEKCEKGYLFVEKIVVETKTKLQLG